MRRIPGRRLLLGLLLLLTAAPGALADNNPSATGGGHYDTEFGLVTFSFQAVEHNDGTVTGQLEWNEHGFFRLHAELDCLYIDGDLAAMSGVITRSTEPLYEGQYVLIVVCDEGEGGAAPPDEVFPIFLDSQPFDCTDALWVPYMAYPLAGGNIQIRP